MNTDARAYSQDIINFQRNNFFQNLFKFDVSCWFTIFIFNNQSVFFLFSYTKSSRVFCTTLFILCTLASNYNALFIFFSIKSNCIHIALFKKSVECEIDIWFSRAVFLWLQPTVWHNSFSTVVIVTLQMKEKTLEEKQQQQNHWKHLCTIS